MGCTASVSLDRAALFLDFDGAFAGFCSAPEAVQPTAERTELLQELRGRLTGRLAVLSGRTLADLDRVTAGAAPAAVALNGLQRRAPGRALPSPPAHRGLAEVEDIAAGLARTWPGVRAERKGLSVALHYREARAAGEELRRIARALARATGLAVQEGAMVVELAMPGWDKGRAVADLMSAPPFRGGAPVYIGDDAADEPGFSAAREAGGFGVLVGPPRETAAIGRLPDPRAVRSWLRDALARGVFEPPERAKEPFGRVGRRLT